jgi:hypothetical protein
VIDVPVVTVAESEKGGRLFKLMLYSYDNPNNNLMGGLFKNISMVDQVARTISSFDEKVLFTILAP